MIEHLRNEYNERRGRENYLANVYACQLASWAKKVERFENSAKKRAKDAKSRETFEKVFPELRKQREDKERFNRVGSRIKSDADMEEIMDGLQEQEVRFFIVNYSSCYSNLCLTVSSRTRKCAHMPSCHPFCLMPGKGDVCL